MSASRARSLRRATRRVAPRALSQLQNYVTIAARRADLPPFLSETFAPLQLIPDAQQMQQRINKSGTYLLTAFAAEDYYPHVGAIPVVIVLTQRP